MIKALQLTNFRSHAQSTLHMEPVTLMVGPAGAGKSNVFKAMVVLQNSVHRELVEIFPPGLGEFHWVRSRWAAETDPIGFEVQVDQIPDYPDTVAKYVLKIADSPAGLYVLEETLTRRQGQQRDDWVFQRRQNRLQMGEFGTVEWDMPTTLHRVWHGAPGIHSMAPNVRFAKSVAKALSDSATTIWRFRNSSHLGRAKIPIVSVTMAKVYQISLHGLSPTPSEPRSTNQLCPICVSCFPRWNQLSSRRTEQTNRA